MASEIHMLKPVCLIENTDADLVINEEALRILSAINQPVVVVAIVGFYRTGKSYLMNKLAGKRTGFSLGSTVQSHTKGIWMWCVPHPKKADHTLVLLDTEGLEDVEKGDNQNDCWIFALAVLLSSTFIYNSIGTINQQAMEQLHVSNVSPTYSSITFSSFATGNMSSFETEIIKKIQMPTETLQELLDLHRPIESEAIEIFLKNSFKDVDQKFQKDLGNLLVAKRDAFVKKNMDLSSARCSDLLEDIFGPLEEEVKQGTFSKPGGYYLFLQMKQELEKKYNQAPGKGLQAEVMLKKYLESKEDVVETLLKTDQSLTEAAKEIEAERIKAEAAEATNRELAEKQKKFELLMQQKEKSYQEHVKQLNEKMKEEQKNLRAEQERIIALKLREQEQFLKEGFQNESKKLRQEIDNMKKSQPSGTCTIL